jgi:quercetin dioxygenase-like cupin family protein
VITVVRGGDNAPSVRGGETFTGEVWRDTVLPTTDGTTIGNVYFTPCARTHWHTHEGGQILIVVAGEGYVGDADGAVRITAGDTVWTPPGVRHWHGASPERAMLHTAIAFGAVDWQEAVSDADYPTDEGSIR